MPAIIPLSLRKRDEKKEEKMAEKNEKIG